MNAKPMYYFAKSRRAFLATIAAAFLLSGCSDDLSRSKAKAMIIKYFKYPIAETEMIKTGSMWDYQLPPRYKRDVWKRKGLIDYRIYKKASRMHITTKASLTLTGQGNRYVIGKAAQDPNIKRVRIAEKQFHEITGIKTSGDKKTAIVEYTWKLGNISPFASVPNGAGDRVFNGSVNMALYDDGWRVAN